jgi:hypothetical protein
MCAVARESRPGRSSALGHGRRRGLRAELATPSGARPALTMIALIVTHGEAGLG